MPMEDTAPGTCGQGLAASAPLPAALATIAASMAENLALHMTALDTIDPAARQEHATYAGLVREFLDIATRLAAAAGHMADARDLPMGRHDEKAMKEPRIRDTFRRMVDAEQDLRTLLDQRLVQDRQMLEQMPPA